jgi:hypothetical protein
MFCAFDEPIDGNRPLQPYHSEAALIEMLEGMKVSEDISPIVRAYSDKVIRTYDFSIDNVIEKIKEMK